MLSQNENYINKIDIFFQFVEAGLVDPEEKLNLTDKDCKTQKNINGFLQGYTGQIVSNDRIILAQRINNHQSERNDLGELVKLRDEQLEEIGIDKEELKKANNLADKGFMNAEVIGN